MHWLRFSRQGMSEFGIVIGKQGKDIPPDQAASHIFGYTCVNDVTAFEPIRMKHRSGKSP